MTLQLPRLQGFVVEREHSAGLQAHSDEQGRHSASAAASFVRKNSGRTYDSVPSARAFA